MLTFFIFVLSIVVIASYFIIRRSIQSGIISRIRQCEIKKIIKNYRLNDHRERVEDIRNNPVFWVRLGNYYVDEVNNPQSAINCYKRAFKLGNMDSLFSIAKTYHHSMFENRRAELTKAIQIYEIVINNPSRFSSVIVRLSETHIDDARHELNVINVQDSRGIQDVIIIDELPEYDTEFQAVILQSLQETDAPIRNEHAHIPQPDAYEHLARYNDSQNVHDHIVQNHTAKMVDRLREKTNFDSNHDDKKSNYREILEYAETKYGRNSEKYDRIGRVLDHIQKYNPIISRHNMSVEECLNRVWKVADKDNILLELSDCIEYDSVVCSTGLFTRIIDSMNDGNIENAMKNTSIIRDEMMNKIGILRNKYYESLSDEDKAIFDSIDESDRQNELVEELKKQIDIEFNRDYVDNGLCMKEIKDEIQKELFLAI